MIQESASQIIPASTRVEFRYSNLGRLGKNYTRFNDLLSVYTLSRIRTVTDRFSGSSSLSVSDESRKKAGTLY